MRTSDSFPFYASLGQPWLDGRVDHTEVAAPADAATISSEWVLAVEPCGDPGTETLRLAAADLRRVLDRAFGVQVSICEGGCRPKEIRLRVAQPGALAEAAPEAHCLRVAENHILVEGNTAVGTMQGVFHLEELMRENGGPFVRAGVFQRSPLFERRIHRSAVSPFYYEEAAGYADTPYRLRTLYGYDIVLPPYNEEEGLPVYYADHVLLGLARSGCNGIWLRGILRLYSATSLYPAGAAYAERALPRIRELCRRAGFYGIRVYIYLNEPMGFADDDPFWQQHPDLRGSPTALDNLRCLCTSQPEVLEFCHEGMRDLFSRVPELAGAILITASEFPTHCWSHTPAVTPQDKAHLVAEGRLCPRCAQRDPRQVVAEVITHLDQGMKEGNPEAQLLAWNWAWRLWEPSPHATILAGLPRDVIVLGDWERDVPARSLDREYINREYSLKLIGPSDGFRGIVHYQSARGVPTYAKLQLGTTHENPTVPYLPVLPAIGHKYRRLHELGVAGIMSCWNFGNMPSIALEAANAFSWAPQEDTVEAVLARVAARYVGRAAAPTLVQAWQLMHESMERAYPGTIPFLYQSPLSRGPAFPWTLARLDRPFPPSWLAVPDAHADDMVHWLDIFGAEGVVRSMQSLDEDWSRAVCLLEQALPLTHGSGKRELRREIGVASACIIQFRTTANTVEFLIARRSYLAASEAQERDRWRECLVEVAQRERDNAAAALPLVDADPRLGFHGEAYGYLYNRPLIERKIKELDQILSSLRPSANLESY